MVTKSSEAPIATNNQGLGVSNLSRATDMKSIAKIKQSFTTFQFGPHAIRVTDVKGEPWFVAIDVCKAMGIVNNRDALDKLDDDEKSTVGLTDSQAGSGAQSISLVSESGMYTLVLRCRDAVKQGSVPHQFRKWVTSEVLPAIRKTGEYKPEVIQRRHIKSRDDLSFTKRDEMGRLLNWFVPSRPDSFHEHVRIGQEFFSEIIELAKNNPKEAYSALCFSGKEMMRFGDSGHALGFAEIWAKFAILAIISNMKTEEITFSSKTMAKEPVEGIDHWFNRAH